MALGGNAAAVAETLAGFCAAMAIAAAWRPDTKRALTANEIADAARTIAPSLTIKFVFIADLFLRSSEIFDFTFVIP